MKEPVFNTLRTELQLGYSVFCQPVNTNGILGFTVVVEAHANKFEYVAYAAKVGEDCVRRDIVRINGRQGNFTHLRGFRRVQSKIHAKVKHARKPFFFVIWTKRSMRSQQTQKGWATVFWWCGCCCHVYSCWVQAFLSFMWIKHDGRWFSIQFKFSSIQFSSKYFVRCNHNN